jgi:hypothetical protein
MVQIFDDSDEIGGLLFPMTSSKPRDISSDPTENDAETISHIRRAVHTCICIKYGIRGVKLASVGRVPRIATLHIWCSFFETPIGTITLLQSQLAQTLLRPLPTTDVFMHERQCVKDRHLRVGCYPARRAWEPVIGDHAPTIATICSYSRTRLLYEALVVMKLPFSSVDALVRSGLNLITLLAICPYQLKQMGLFLLGPRIKIEAWQMHVKRRLAQLHKLLPPMAQIQMPYSQTLTTTWQPSLDRSLPTMLQELRVRNLNAHEIIASYINWLCKRSTDTH